MENTVKKHLGGIDMEKVNVKKSQRLHRRKERGFTLIELLIVMSIIISATVLGFVVFNTKIKPNQYVNGKIQAFSGLLAGLENVKSFNGNAYPLMAQAITLPITSPTTDAQRLIMQATGRANNEYAGWQYQCNNGTLTITVSLRDTTDTDLRVNTRNAIANGNREFTCTAVDTNGNFTCTKNNVVCQ